jgi:hypothetical protein
MRVYDSPLCIVASHLASGDKEGDETFRNNDAADIKRRHVRRRRLGGLGGRMLRGSCRVLGAAASGAAARM